METSLSVNDRGAIEKLHDVRPNFALFVIFKGINRLSCREGVIAKCRDSSDAFNLHRPTTIVRRINGETVGRCSTIISV